MEPRCLTKICKTLPDLALPTFPTLSGAPHPMLFSACIASFQFPEHAVLFLPQGWADLSQCLFSLPTVHVKKLGAQRLYLPEATW